MSFTSIVVPVDLEHRAAGILLYVSRLAGPAGLPVELVTASSPLMPEGCDRWELGRMAAGLEDQGTACRITVVHSDDPARAIVELLAERERPLLAMATHARGLLAGTLLGSVSEAVLTRHPGPTLLFGPRAVLEDHPSLPTLMAAIDDGPRSEAVLDALVAWYNSFGGPEPWLVEVVEPARVGVAAAGVDVIESTRLRAVAESVRARGVSVQWDVLHGRYPADALLEYADRTTDAVVALASERWTDPDHRHIVSVARGVTRGCRHPVMVVPTHRAEDGASP